MTAPWPILYSFRRCPYAMRARMAVAVSGQACELREVVLRHKPAELLLASAKGTVPVLVDVDGEVIAESLDIMHWALARHDPEEWLVPEQGRLDDMLVLIGQIDGPFKFNLDRYKYPQRHALPDGTDLAAASDAHRAAGVEILQKLDERLRDQPFLFGHRRALADMAAAPFVRQFAHVDPGWFAAQPWPGLQAWLKSWEDSAVFAGVMHKYTPWQSGTAGIRFPETAA